MNQKNEISSITTLVLFSILFFATTALAEPNPPILQQQPLTQTYQKKTQDLQIQKRQIQKPNLQILPPKSISTGAWINFDNRYKNTPVDLLEGTFCLDGFNNGICMRPQRDLQSSPTEFWIGQENYAKINLKFKDSTGAMTGSVDLNLTNFPAGHQYIYRFPRPVTYLKGEFMQNNCNGITNNGANPQIFAMPIEAVMELNITDKNGQRLYDMRRVNNQYKVKVNCVYRGSN